MIDDHLTAPSIRYVFTPKVKNKKKKRIQPLFHCNALESVDEIIKARKLQWITSKIERKKKKKPRTQSFLFEFLAFCLSAPVQNTSEIMKWKLFALKQTPDEGGSDSQFSF